MLKKTLPIYLASFLLIFAVFSIVTLFSKKINNYKSDSILGIVINNDLNTCSDYTNIDCNTQAIKKVCGYFVINNKKVVRYSFLNECSYCKMASKNTPLGLIKVKPQGFTKGECD